MSGEACETGASLKHVCMDYPKTLLHGLQNLRLQGDFNDVQLRVGGSVFPAHRVVLSIASPYFRAMFTGDMCELGKAEIELHEIEPSIFQLLLDFMYSGEGLY